MTFVQRADRLIVTGGTGYIGSRLAALAVKEGRHVILLGRSPQGCVKGTVFIPWELGDRIPTAAMEPAGIRTAVIHLAHDWRTTPCNENHPNFQGTQSLWTSARALGIQRFVFVSSQSARADALNVYGRVKWRIGNALIGEDTVTARIGLVYGGPKAGMFRLISALSRLPILPMICPGQQVQPIHLDEVCLGLLLLADSALTGWRGLAGPQPMAFGDVLRTLARENYGRRILVLPVPMSLALIGARLTSFVPFIPTIDKERILGLAGTRYTPCADDLADIGLSVVPLAIGLRQSIQGRKALIAEGKALLHYVLGAAPSLLLQRLYVRAVHACAPDAGAIGLFPLLMAYPSLLRFVEPLKATNSLAQRMRLATTLADSSAEGAHVLCAASRGGRILNLAVAMMLDVCALPVRLLVSIASR
jgi:nucleoside-diphosphate-sugar epimerase